MRADSVIRTYMLHFDAEVKAPSSKEAEHFHASKKVQPERLTKRTSIHVLKAHLEEDEQEEEE